jgi:hypothetical protein
MSARQPLWQPAARSRLHEGLGQLRACLLTTFEPPDAHFLVEELLPEWLDMSRRSSEHAAEQTLFEVDLQRRLQDLRGRFCIFSSSRPADSLGHWLWSDCHLHTVGRTHRATQHAKVWLFHWASEAHEHGVLEAVVSSANLTRQGFTTQVQGGWRLLVPLQDRRRSTAGSNLASWGVLPAFLEALGAQSSPHAIDDVSYWIRDVLPRAACPRDVTFVASVPGRHTASTLAHATSAWGTAGIRFAHSGRLTGLDVVVPTLGTLKKGDPRDERHSLTAWAKRFGVRADRIRLAWAEKGRSDVDGRWQMPRVTENTLRSVGVDIRRFPDPSEKDSSMPRFHREWQAADRWMHGKLYWLRARNSTHLLITSANWSTSAWGRTEGDGLCIENFEFGVAFASDWAPVAAMRPLKGALHTQPPEPRPPEPAVAWAEAAWNGTVIDVDVRLGGHDRKRVPSERMTVRCADEDTDLAGRWKPTEPACFTARVRWHGRQGQGQPLSLDITVEGMTGEPVHVPIADVRPVKHGTPALLRGLPPEEAARLETRLLEERYGGPEAEPKPPGTRGGGTRGRAEANYEVATIVAAREKFDIVSCWARCLENAAGRAREVALRDGNRLAELWRAHHDVAIRVAREELEARLKFHEQPQQARPRKAAR